MWANQIDVEQPIEMYDRVRAELVNKIGGDLPEGCLMHMVTRRGAGFRVIEVWENHEAADRFGDEVMRPLIEQVAGPEVAAGGPPPSQELELHRLQAAAAVTV